MASSIEYISLVQYSNLTRLLTRGPSTYPTVNVAVKGVTVVVAGVVLDETLVIEMVAVVEVPTSTTKVQANVVISASSISCTGTVQ
jgi:hypothetical protein